MRYTIVTLVFYAIQYSEGPRRCSRYSLAIFDTKESYPQTIFQLTDGQTIVRFISVAEVGADMDPDHIAHVIDSLVCIL